MSIGDDAHLQTAPAPLLGLSEQEALARRARGEGNIAPASTSRTYRQIIVENVFTFINLCLLGLGISLALLGRVLDALISTAIISMNVIVSVVQEIRAKRTLDRIALLARPQASVLRDGQEKEIPPDEVVCGDVLKVGPGDQILVDGRVVVGGHMAVDESLLTGEPDHVVKDAGDEVFSGSFCVAGGGYYLAERVGVKSLAHQMTASAKAFRRVLTPLQQEINLVIRIALLIVVYMELLLVLTSVLKKISLPDSVENSAIVAGLVPNGLFLSIAVAYALGAVRILRFGALIQQPNAIESLSHVDVLCLDKTGTLTTNRMQVASVYPIGASVEEVGQALGAVAASASTGNKTTDALRAAWPSPAMPLTDEIPFSSARRWSGVAFERQPDHDGSLRGVYVLGAPEMLLPSLLTSDDKHELSVVRAIEEQVRSLAARGLRVLLIAHTSDVHALEDHGDASEPPAHLEPLGLVALEDELRPEAREALAAFAQAGVRPKIISGDNPQTVAALARQAGIGPEFEVVSGPELENMSEQAFEVAAESATIFGRISPQQKERLVRALRRRGHYVAMIGDGANDVLSLKQANLGIAMRSGSDAARGVADVVLMQDSFAVLVPAVAEGQRILNGMQDILKLFLTRISTIGLVILSSLVIGAFPLELRQGSLVTFFSVGVPSIALAVWAQPGPQPPIPLIRRLFHFIVPPMLLTSLIGLFLFAGAYELRLAHAGLLVGGRPAPLVEDYPIAQSTLTAFLVVTGLLLIIFVQPPSPWWVGANAISHDRRPTLLAVGMMAAFILVTALPPLRAMFALSALGPQEYLLITVAVLVWLMTIRIVWRTRLLSRYLSVDLH